MKNHIKKAGKIKEKNWNKRGGERIISLYWFLLWVIAAVGIAASVFAFTSYTVDTRPYEAKILTKTLLNCLTKDGSLIPEYFTPSFDIEKTCNLNLKSNGVYEYYIEVNLYNYESCNEGKCTQPVTIEEKATSHVVGNPSLKVYCATNAKGKTPRCFDGAFYILEEKKPAFIQINIIVNKQLQNVK